MGPIGIYYLVSVDGRDFAGAFNKPSDMPGPPAWLGYVRVKNVESTVKAAKKAGGTLINGPMEVPGGDWVAQLLDPQGGMFAVHMLAADVQAAASTAQSSPAEAPATIEVTGAARSEERAAAKPAASKPAAKKASGKTESTAKAKTKSAAKPASKSKTATRTKKKSAKTLKRSSRKAVKVRSQTSRSKAKAAPQRKKSASKPKKRAAAKAKKGK
jgi:hypothetical protein